MPTVCCMIIKSPLPLVTYCPFHCPLGYLCPIMMPQKLLCQPLPFLSLSAVRCWASPQNIHPLSSSSKDCVAGMSDILFCRLLPVHNCTPCTTAADLTDSLSPLLGGHGLLPHHLPRFWTLVLAGAHSTDSLASWAHSYPQEAESGFHWHS